MAHEPLLNIYMRVCIPQAGALVCCLCVSQTFAVPEGFLLYAFSDILSYFFPHFFPSESVSNFLGGGSAEM